MTVNVSIKIEGINYTDASTIAINDWKVTATIPKPLEQAVFVHIYFKRYAFLPPKAATLTIPKGETKVEGGWKKIFYFTIYTTANLTGEHPGENPQAYEGFTVGADLGSWQWHSKEITVSLSYEYLDKVKYNGSDIYCLKYKGQTHFLDNLHCDEMEKRGIRLWFEKTDEGEDGEESSSSAQPSMRHFIKGRIHVDMINSLWPKKASMAIEGLSGVAGANLGFKFISKRLFGYGYTHHKRFIWGTVDGNWVFATDDNYFEYGYIDLEGGIGWAFAEEKYYYDSGESLLLEIYNSYNTVKAEGEGVCYSHKAFLGDAIEYYLDIRRVKCPGF